MFHLSPTILTKWLRLSQGVAEISGAQAVEKRIFAPTTSTLDEWEAVLQRQCMLRSELIDTLHKENPHLTRRDMERVVAVVLESITQTLEQGARVELRGFGAFSTRKRKARAGRNPRTGEDVFVPEKHVPFFRTGKDLRVRIDSRK